MNIDDIKVGEPYNVLVHFRKITPDGKLWISEADEGNIIKLTFDGAYVSTQHLLFSPDLISPVPKHDPCRLFREGDIAEVVMRDGRKPDDGAPVGITVRVVNDEADGKVRVYHRPGAAHTTYTVSALFLKLLTPVEELEPYVVTESSDYWGVDKDDLEVEAAIFWKKSHQHGKEAAESECKRLNEQHRKEQEND